MGAAEKTTGDDRTSTKRRRANAITASTAAALADLLGPIIIGGVASGGTHMVSSTSACVGRAAQ